MSVRVCLLSVLCLSPLSPVWRLSVLELVVCIVCLGLVPDTEPKPWHIESRVQRSNLRHLLSTNSFSFKTSKTDYPIFSKRVSITGHRNKLCENSVIVFILSKERV